MLNIKRKILKPLVITAAVLLVQFSFVPCLLAKPIIYDPPKPLIKDLGTLGGADSSAIGINNNGQVIGWSETAGKIERHAFIWENGKMTDLGAFGGDWSGALAINDNGQVVGDFIKNRIHGFIWDNGKMVDLGTLGGNESSARGINNNGQVVGWSVIAEGKATHAFIWEKGKMDDLGTLGGNDSYAYGINNKGQIVGSACIEGNITHGFIWEKDKMTDLGTLGGSNSYAMGINDKGQIVGYSEIKKGSNIQHAFLWENGKMIDLGTLRGEGYSESSFATKINEKGQIIGWCDEDAFMYDNGKMTRLNELLNELGGLQSKAYGINDKGQIVGLVGKCDVNRNLSTGAFIWEDIIPNNSITCDNTVFNLSNPQDMKVTISGSRLLAIKNGPAALSNIDYSVSGNTVTIKKDYLTYFFKKFNYPLQKLNLVFDFEEGNDPVFTATQMPITNYVTSDNSVFDLSNPQDITLNIKGNTLTAIKNGSAALKNAVDYSISGSTVTIKKSYLKYFFTKFTDPWQKLNLEFDFEKGNDPLFSISKK